MPFNINQEKALSVLIKLSKKINKPQGTKVEKNHNAKLFKQNIELSATSEPGSQYECIFKNLIRDFRLYF